MGEVGSVLGTDPPGESRHRWRAWFCSRWAVLGLGYTLLVAAWIVANTPSAVPDEPANLIRAAGIGQGDLEGAAAHYEPGVLDYLTAPQRAFFEEQSQSFLIPARATPIDPGCFAFRPEQTAACLRTTPAPTTGSLRMITYVGAYPPLAYLPAALATRLATEPLQANMIGRALSALPCLLLLVGAMWLLDWGPSRWPLAAGVLAATPLTVFFASGVNPSGVELCAALCVGAGLVALASGRRGRGLWAVLAAAGATFALSRPASFALAGAVVIAALPILSWRTLREQRGAALLAGGAVAAAALLGLAWAMTHQPRLPLRWAALPGAVAHVALLVAGKVLGRRNLLQSWGPAAVGLLMAAVQLGGIWYTGRRYAVGRHGSEFFIPVAQWSPLGDGYPCWGWQPPVRCSC